MLMHRLKTAVVCLFVTIGAIVGTIPSCGRAVTPAGPVCCKNEATCPMHQKHAAFGLDVCRGDGGVASAGGASPPAGLGATILKAQTPPRGDGVLTKKDLLFPPSQLSPA